MPLSTIHATCLIIGEQGVLIRGAPGAGKSRLARALMTEAALRGLYAGLVGDDRVAIEAVGGRIIARGHPEVAGLIEARGLGIRANASEPACVVRLVVDLAPERGPRLPDAAEQTTLLNGLSAPRLTLGPDSDRADLVLSALRLSAKHDRGPADTGAHL